MSEDKRFAYDKLIYKGPVAEVHSVGLTMPDGQVVQRDFVRYRAAAVVLPVLADGSVVLIRNYRFAVDELLLELPAGMVEDEEEPAVCAARELTEETGYAAGRMELLGMFYTGPGSTDERMYAYLASDLRKGAQDLEAYEQIEVRVEPPGRIRGMIADGTIHDGKTIAAFALYWLRKEAV